MTRIEAAKLARELIEAQAREIAGSDYFGPATELDAAEQVLRDKLLEIDQMQAKLLICSMLGGI